MHKFVIINKIKPNKLFTKYYITLFTEGLDKYIAESMIYVIPNNEQYTLETVLYEDGIGKFTKLREY